MSTNRIVDAIHQCEIIPDSMAAYMELIFALQDVVDREGEIIVAANRLLGRGQPAHIRYLIGAQLMEVACWKQALPWFQGDDPDLQEGRAWALALIGQREEARILYDTLQRTRPDRALPGLKSELGIA